MIGIFFLSFVTFLLSPIPTFPSEGVLWTVGKEKIKNNDTAFLSIYDINGRVVFQENVKNEQAISTENFARGIYILKINTKNTSVFKKIIVE